MSDQGADPGHSRAPRLPAPGWMPDPGMTHLERYWDGTRWTQHTRDRATHALTPRDDLAYRPRAWTPDEAVPASARGRRARRPRRRFSITRVLATTFAVLMVTAVAYQYGTATGYIAPLTAAAAPLPGAAPLAPAPAAADAPDLTTPPARAEVAYPVFGSTELVRHLAAGLIAQQESIDVSFYAQTVGVDGIVDAMHEAHAQNPYVFSTASEIQTLGDQVTVHPTYAYDAAEAERRRVETQRAAADAMVASGASSATGDVEKVTLIHDWIVDHATYDVGAFDALNARETSPRVVQSQEAYGILVMGTAVCTGYAESFTVMAEMAGLETVIITGTDTSGETGGDHAWNKVLIDGEWLLVDTTWDDPVAPEPVRLDDYLLLEDGDPLLASRTSDDAWAVDGNLSAFGS